MDNEKSKTNPKIMDFLLTTVFPSYIPEMLINPPRFIKRITSTFWAFLSFFFPTVFKNKEAAF